MLDVIEIDINVKGFSIKNISLNVKTHTIHCLIGPTGCGKTTLLEAILGLRKIKKGKIFLEGKDITNFPVHKRGFSYVPQDLAIFPHLTVQENIFYGIHYGNVKDKKESYKRAIELAKILGISHLLQRRAVNLSGGERQRVALARALASDQKYILLDEPFSSLHEGMKKELWFLLKELQKKFDFTILMISHDLEEIFFLSDYISVMMEGRILQTDKKEIVYYNPKTLPIAKFLGIKNIFSAKFISVEQEYYKFYCDSLQKEIILQKQKIENFSKKNIMLGIRSEDILILRSDPPKKNENLLKGVIKEIFSAGSNVTILFQPYGSQELLEIIIPEFVVIQLSLKPQIEAIAELRSERFFVLE